MRKCEKEKIDGCEEKKRDFVGAKENKNYFCRWNEFVFQSTITK